MRFLPLPLTEQGGIWSTFLAFITEQYNYFLNKILNLRYIFSAERTPFPLDVANFVGAYVSAEDVVNVVRTKIGKAIETHKHLPEFAAVYKPVIDTILGVDSEIVTDPFIPEIFVIDQSLIDGNSFIESYSSPAGVAKSKGQILINVTRAVTDAERTKLLSQLREICILYFYIYIGYSVTVSASPFVIDSGSLIDGTDGIDYDVPAGDYFQPQFLLNE
jgi:hypothetical protein